jgi:hypothetical protein
MVDVTDDDVPSLSQWMEYTSRNILNLFIYVHRDNDWGKRKTWKGGWRSDGLDRREEMSLTPAEWLFSSHEGLHIMKLVPN